MGTIEKLIEKAVQLAGRRPAGYHHLRLACLLGPSLAPYLCTATAASTSSTSTTTNCAFSSEAGDTRIVHKAPFL